MKKLLFTFLAALYCTVMNAQTAFEVGGIKYSVTGENTVEVVAKDSEYTGDVVIPSTVTSDGITYDVTRIGDRAFYFCTNLASITFPASVNSIGYEAFHECKSLTSITIPKNVTSIGTYAFVNCQGLASITVAEENTIYESPDNCNAIIEKSTQTLLWGCKNTVIPNTVTIINNKAFHMHTGLTSITIPESVTSIGEGAFQSTGLTSVIIGKSVKTIGEDAFRNCRYMTEIDVLATTPPTLGTDAFSMVPTDIPVYVPDVDAYKKKSWGGFTNLRKYVDLPIAKEEAIADLQTFINEGKIANAPMEKYESCINTATALKYIPSIVNDIKAEINKYTKFTLGEWKYLLDKNDEKYTIVGGSLTFTDKDIYQCDYDFTANNLTYSRTFKNTKWQPLYVPFAMEYYDWKGNFDVAAINNFHEYSDDKTGEIVKTELEIRMVKSGTLKPNHPYLIKAHDAAKPLQIELTTKEISKSDNKSYSCSSMESQYTFTGTYQEMNKLKTNDYIFMSGGKLCKAEDDEVKLSAQRWYLSIKSLGSQVDGGSTSDVKAMEFDIKLLDDEATDIDEITVTRTPLRNSSEAIYNLNGMRVNDSYKGIVIKNGKKVLQK